MADSENKAPSTPMIRMGDKKEDKTFRKPISWILGILGAFLVIVLLKNLPISLPVVIISAIVLGVIILGFVLLRKTSSFSLHRIGTFIGWFYETAGFAWIFSWAIIWVLLAAVDMPRAMSLVCGSAAVAWWLFHVLFLLVWGVFLAKKGQKGGLKFVKVTVDIPLLAYVFYSVFFFIIGVKAPLMYPFERIGTPQTMIVAASPTQVATSPVKLVNFVREIRDGRYEVQLTPRTADSAVGWHPTWVDNVILKIDLKPNTKSVVFDHFEEPTGGIVVHGQRKRVKKGTLYLALFEEGAEKALWKGPLPKNHSLSLPKREKRLFLWVVILRDRDTGEGVLRFRVLERS